MNNAKKLFFHSYYKVNKNKIIGHIIACGKLNKKNYNSLLTILGGK